MIETLSDLQKFLKICRKQGVKHIKLSDLEITLNDNASKAELADTDETVTSHDPSFEDFAASII